MTIATMHEATTNFSQLVAREGRGEEIILAEAGRPMARLMPLAAGPVRRVPGRLKGRLPDSVFDPLPDDELRPWTCEDE